MEILPELRKKIEKTFDSKKDLKEQLLLGNTNAIKGLAIMLQKGVSPEDIIKSYENDRMDSLYLKAKKMMDAKKIYEELCEIYAKNRTDTMDIER